MKIYNSLGLFIILVVLVIAMIYVFGTNGGLI